MELTWKEPPAKRGALMDYPALVEALKGRPGEWALIFTETLTSYTQTLQRHGLETRNVSAGLGYPAGKFDIYARWPEETQTIAA